MIEYQQFSHGDVKVHHICKNKNQCCLKFSYLCDKTNIYTIVRIKYIKFMYMLFVFKIFCIASVWLYLCSMHLTKQSKWYYSNFSWFYERVVDNILNSRNADSIIPWISQVQSLVLRLNALKYKINNFALINWLGTPPDI